MDKILISNSFKNLLQSLGAKTSNSNYAVPVVTAGSGTTAGTPQGYMDMASLASVLGVIQDRVNIQSNSTLTIPKGKKAAVIMCWCNTATASAPLIAVCSRTSSIQAVIDSACIMVGQETTNFVGIVVDSDGNIVVYNKLNQIITFKYHLFLCEQ